MKCLVARNFQCRYGKQLATAFVAELLSNVTRPGTENTFVISCDDLSSGSETDNFNGIPIHRVRSLLTISSPLIYRELLWLKRNNVSLTKSLLQRNIDFVRIVRKTMKTCSGDDIVHWFDIFNPIWRGLHLLPKFRLMTSYATFFGLTGSTSLYDHVLRTFSESIDMIIVTTLALERYMKKRVGVATDKIRSIPLGVDLSHFHPPADKRELKESMGFERSSKIATWFGPIAPSGSQEFYSLVNFARDAQKVMPSLHFLFVFKYGIPADVADLEGGSIRFYHDVSNIADLLKLGDLTLLPFSRRTGWISYQPLTVLQSLACGVPVVSMNYPGIDEAIIKGYNGALVDKVSEIPRAAVSLLQHEQDLEKMSDHARASAERRYDIVKVAREYEKLWNT